MPYPSEPTSPRPPRSAGRGYAVAAGCVILAVAARAALTPVLGDQTPFLTVFLAVLAAAEIGGFKAAVATSAVGGLLAWALFVPTRDPVPLALFGVAIFGTCLFVRRAEAGAAALRDREDQLRTLADNLPAAVYQVVREPGRPSRFRHVTAGVERLAGVTPAEVLADPTALYSRILPDDLPGVLAAQEEAGRTGTPFDREIRQRWPDGTVTWVHARSAPRKLPDGTVVFDGVMTDITARKRAEAEIARLDRERAAQGAELQTLMDLLPVGVAVAHDPACRTITANPALAALVGMSADANVSKTGPAADDLPYLVVRDGREIPPAELPMQTTAATGVGVAGWECEIRYRDGRPTRHLLVNTAPLLDAAGRLRGCVAAHTDVTDRKAAEDALREEARRKDEFLAMLGHELRNPLAPIRNGISILAHPRTDPATAARVRGMMTRQVEHLVRLVDDLLDMARIIQGKIGLRRDRIDLRAVVGRAVETARPGVDAKGHHLAVELPPGPVWVTGDEVRLTQVVANLLANAAKYSDPGGRIIVDCGLVIDDLKSPVRNPQSAIVKVRDTGVGIAPDMLGKVFDLFVQVEKTAARTDGGLGIGLTLVKRLVEMHGGTAAAASGGPGRGSEFTVRLPIADLRLEIEDQTRQPEVQHHGIQSSIINHQSSIKNILVVDDNADAAATLAAVLEMRGHRVWTAADGPAALGLAADGCRPDAVVLDIGLPGMDGYEVARRLRAGPAAGATLIALTGYGRDDDRQRAADAGFDHHFTKPVDLDELARVLTR